MTDRDGGRLLGAPCGCGGVATGLTVPAGTDPTAGLNVHTIDFGTVETAWHLHPGGRR